MNICILIPSEEFRKSAGVRIRYERILDNLNLLRHELHILNIQDFIEPEQFTHDIYIMSKCYDARALLVACLLARSQKLVGIDLFDDYFSQAYDNRFTRERYCLHTILKSIDFIICSTPAMGKLAESLAPGLAVHVMNDPSPPIDTGNIRKRIRRKQEQITKTKILNVGWFGIGDNPYFPVGLRDLVAFGGELAQLRDRGFFDVRLNILTNKRAMTADALASLRRLPLPYFIDEWTVEREVALLDKVIVCFLPVKAQSFSTVKSLNRAVSVLSAGVQALSSGYPLYGCLSPFVYRDPEKLLEDIKGNSLALRDETVPKLVRLLERWADPAKEASGLAEFLNTCYKYNSFIPVIPTQQPFAAVIHGIQGGGHVHKFAQALGALSISSPICEAKLNFDIRFSFNTDKTGIVVYISEKYWPMLDRNIQALLSSHSKNYGTNYKKLDLSHMSPQMIPSGNALGLIDPPMNFAAGNANMIANITRQVRVMFPGIVCFYSDHTELPWRWNLLSDISWNDELV